MSQWKIRLLQLVILAVGASVATTIHNYQKPESSFWREFIVQLLFFYGLCLLLEGIDYYRRKDEEPEE